jgi:hypothetical protein
MNTSPSKKNSFRALIVLATFILQSFSISTSDPNCDSIPELNKQIIDFVKTKLNKKVGHGECWDLASEALNSAGAEWDHDYKFGKELDLKKDCVFPGDIIQFEKVKVEFEKNGSFYKQDLQHHTAVIYKVNEKNSFIMAEQNTSQHGKKVSLSPIDLNNITKGKVTIYRPVK